MGEMIKSGGDRVVDWTWRLCNMSFESGIVLEDWRSAVKGWNGIIIEVVKHDWKNICRDPSKQSL